MLKLHVVSSYILDADSYDVTTKRAKSVCELGMRICTNVHVSTAVMFAPFGTEI